MTTYETIQLLNEIELSKLLRRGVQTLRNDRYRGIGIPFVKIGRSVRYRLADIEDFIDQNLVSTRPAIPEIR